MTKENNKTIINKLNNNNLNIKCPLSINDGQKKENKFCFSNCKLINKQILNVFSEIDENINTKKEPINAIFDKGKVIILYNNEIINVGNLNTSNEFTVEYLIYPNIPNYLLSIFNHIKTKGYESIEPNISKGSIYSTINNTPIKTATIIDLRKDKKPSVKLIDISEKLKVLLLLSIFQQRKYIIKNNKHNKHELEKVFLINKDLLINYQYESINNLIMGNIEKKDLIEHFFVSNTDPESLSLKFNDILSKLDQQKLKEIDNQINQTIYPNSLQAIPPEQLQLYSLDAIPEQLQLSSQKIIKIYKNFIISNQYIYDLLKKIFTMHSPSEDIYYFYNEGDFIIMTNKCFSKKIFIIYWNNYFIFIYFA